MRRAALLFAFVLLACKSSPKAEEARGTDATSALLAAFPQAAPPANARARDGAMVFERTSIPARSAGAATITNEGVTLEVTPLDVNDASSAEERGVLAYPGAIAGGHLVWSASHDRIEELRQLSKVEGEYRARYRLRLQGGAKAVAFGDRVHVMTDDGRRVIAGLPMEAIDAAGKHRSLVARIDGEGESTTLTVTLATDGLVAPLAIDPAWVTGPAMKVTRSDARAVTLLDGRTLVMGGEYQGSRYTAATEAYDPTTNTFVDTGTGGGGQGQAVAMTSGGRVVRAGGFIGLNPLKTASVFDPVASSWTPLTTAFPYYMDDAAAAPTASNEVLVCGGTAGSGATGAECFLVNTVSFTWSSAAAMPAARSAFAMIALADGTVLAAGGGTAVWRYNRTSNAWTTASSTKGIYSRPTLTRLASGKVLILGGGASSGELFDPATGTWGSTGSLAVGRNGHTATLLKNGKVLIAGGGSANAEIYDPATNTFGPGGTMTFARSLHVAGLLPDGRVIAAGDQSIDNSSEIWGRLVAETCVANYECVNGQCVDGVCCGTASCSPGAHCNVPGKVGTCSKSNGTACAAASECASGNCVDGVCCNTACTGQCSSCNLAGKAGTCSAVYGDPVSGRPACGGAGAGTTCGARCDGSSLTACVFPTTSTACGSDGCTGGVETHSGTCNGAGACTSLSKSCGAYVCGGTSCKTTCASITDCVTGFYCKAGTCAPAEGLGKACTTAGDCSTGFCTDGVCCGVGYCGDGSSCALPGHLGTCNKKLSTACANDAECGSGFCTDGVCCEQRCDGQCEACDVEGKIGLCVPVNGSPHGARPACDSGGGDACKALTCKSSDPKTCTGFAAGATTTCAAAACAGSDFTGESRCDGAGTCIAPKATSCVPYVCETTGCRKTCETDAHCVKGFSCIGGRCEAKPATCTDDALGSVATDGTTTSCVPYRCLDSGDCGRTCGYSSDCAPGYVCDGSACVAGAPEAADSGGCVWDPNPSGPPPWLVAMGAIVALGLVSRARGGR